MPNFGMLYSRIQQEVPIPEFAPAVEEMGFDSVWVSEGLVNELPQLDVVVALQAFADHTKAISVGTCVLLLPLRNPVLLAKEIGSIDVLSHGRVILGVGVGGSVVGNSGNASFEATGIPLKERGDRADEGLQILRELWSGERVSHSGRFHHFKDIVMEPPPHQRPHPPLWAGQGNAPRVLERVARYCDGWVPASVTPGEYAKAWTRIEEYLAESNRIGTELTKALHLYLSLDVDAENARRVAHRTLSDRYDFEATLAPDECYAFGTPDDCIKSIQRFVDVGVTDFVFNITRPLPEVFGQIGWFQSDVLPAFR